ncbi:MAG: hypothetical protein PHW56_00805 [Methanosarcinaceae archaeon]|nr:hypothetical protein [Methanosarcinaceae archaeon]
MKPENFLPATCIILLLTILLLSGTGAAAFSYSNSITLNPGNATWGYEEYVTGKEASFSRQLIDNQAGNNDSFVNVWELISMERRFGERLRESIEKKPDIKFNNSSETVKVLDVEYRFSEESLGNVFKTKALKNRAFVKYSIDKGALAPGTEAWFRGTPESKVRVILPPGLDVNETGGLENSTVSFKNDRAVLEGRFDEKGEMTLRFSENKSFNPKSSEEALNVSSAEEMNVSAPEKPIKAQEPDMFNYFDGLKDKLARSLEV